VGREGGNRTADIAADTQVSSSTCMNSVSLWVLGATLGGATLGKRFC